MQLAGLYSAAHADVKLAQSPLPVTQLAKEA